MYSGTKSKTQHTYIFEQCAILNSKIIIGTVINVIQHVYNEQLQNAHRVDFV